MDPQTDKQPDSQAALNKRPSQAKRMSLSDFGGRKALLTFSVQRAEEKYDSLIFFGPFITEPHLLSPSTIFLAFCEATLYKLHVDLWFSSSYLLLICSQQEDRAHAAFYQFLSYSVVQQLTAQ